MLLKLKAKLALALVVLLGTLTACDGGQPAGTTTTPIPITATVQPTLAAAPTLPAGGATPPTSSSSFGSIIGQVIETKAMGGAPGVRLTVQEVREVIELSGGGKTVKAKGKFVLVLVKAEGINPNGRNIGFSSTKLKDSDGVLYGVNNYDAQGAAAGETGRESSYYIMAPGKVVESVIVYEVPSGATGFILVASEV